MKLNVGDYAYIKGKRRFGIGKIFSIQARNCVMISFKDRVHLESIGNIISSPNIIDLIRKNEDYVNGKLLDEGEYEFYKTYPVYIKSVVTKEQFEQMEYKVED